MKTTIKNGVTIISTGDSGNGIRNRTGFVGITEKPNGLRAEITINQHKYALGHFPTIEDAVNARKVAEIKKEDGTFEELIKNKPHGKSSNFLEYWKALFEEYHLI